MKAYYEAPTLGDGLSLGSAFRPDLPVGAAGWVLFSEPGGAPSVTVLVSADSAYHTALSTNPSVVWLAGVPVARNIAAVEMVAGRRCAVAFFAEGDPKDGVVIAVYI